jgi:hypothetical protein
MQRSKIWLFVLVIAATPALAQENDSPDARRGAVRELFAAREEDRIMEAMIESLADAYVVSMHRLHPEIAQEPLDNLRNAIRTNLAATKDDYLSHEESMLAEHLSLEDLRTAIEFYKTPAGKRLADIAPSLIPEAAKDQLAWTSAAIKKATDDVNAGSRDGK